ncbi:MAG: GNAT family N-acetyltransferase [Clostridiales bacterium]|nr:GNAT family N-acetyltransferase [Clostridiales bacterium]
MKDCEILKLRDHPRWKEEASAWFASKWGIPREEYLSSMDTCLAGQVPVPQWYIVVDAGDIIAGLGVIENDFHNRKDLDPNVCAVYVEKAYRRRGIAKAMLDFVCRDLRDMGIATLYLLTDHTSFYEHCGWKFLCMVQGNGEEEMSRMYVKESRSGVTVQPSTAPRGCCVPVAHI